MTTAPYWCLMEEERGFKSCLCTNLLPPSTRAARHPDPPEEQWPRTGQQSILWPCLLQDKGTTGPGMG